MVPVLVALVFLAGMFLSAHGALRNVDGIYEAQVARNVWEGKGYTTNEIPLYAVFYAQQHGLSLGPPWVNSLEFPLPIALQTLVISAVGPNLAVVTTGFSATCFLASVAVCSRVVSSWTGRFRPALISAGLVATNPFLLEAGLSGKADSLDLLLFLVALWLLLAARSGARHPQRRAVWLGVIVGLMFLSMFSEGIIGGSTIAVLLLWRSTKTWGLVRGLRFTGLYLLAAALTVVPYLAAFAAAYHTLPISGNIPLQLVSFTPSAKFMNAWWKLTYPPSAANLFPYLAAYHGQVWAKSVLFAESTVWGFLWLGTPYLVYQPAPSAYVSLWWIPVAASLYLGIRARSRWGLEPEHRGIVRGLGWLVAGNLALSLVLLSPLAGGIEYVEYLFPAVLILAGVGVDRGLKGLSLGLRTVWARATEYFAPVRGTAPDTRTASLRWSSRPARLGMGAAVSAALACLVVVPSAFYVGFVPGSSNSVYLSDWLTDRDPGALELLRSITGPEQVVVAAEPWNVAWNDQLHAVPLPEYPDEVYSLIGEGLNVSAVYVANLDSAFFSDVGAPYTYDAYVREALLGYSLAGFTLVHRGTTPVGPDIVLQRDPKVPIQTLLSTPTVVFGNSSDASHQVWGWSPDDVVNGRPAAWAGRPGGTPVPEAPATSSYGCGALTYSTGFCLPSIDFVNASGVGGGGWYPTRGSLPEAEVTILRNASTAATLQATVLSPVPGQSIALVVNANLVSFGQPGTLVGVDPVGPAHLWTTLTFEVPPGILVPGVNVLDFFFSENATGVANSGNLPVVFAAFNQISVA